MLVYCLLLVGIAFSLFFLLRGGEPKLTDQAPPQTAVSLRAENASESAKQSTAQQAADANEKKTPEVAAVQPKVQIAEVAPIETASEGARLNLEGHSLIRQGRFNDAIPVLQRALQAFPKDTTDISYIYAMYNLGHALRRAGRPAEAVPYLEQCVRSNPKQSMFVQELASARRAAMKKDWGLRTED